MVGGRTAWLKDETQERVQDQPQEQQQGRGGAQAATGTGGEGTEGGARGKHCAGKMGAEGEEECKEVRRVRRSVNQNLGRAYCWATCVETGQPCTEKVAEGSNIPYCERHMREGDGALMVLDHPTNEEVGKIVVARIDLPKGYKMVYWGQRCRWRGCKAPDKAMSFLPNGGVIDPSGLAGQQVQYMACPGPGERSNTKCTGVCFGKTYDTKLVGREFETSEAVKKDHQLLQWYGSKEWFEARDIPRTNVGTPQYPTPLRKKKSKRKKKSAPSREEDFFPKDILPKGLLVASPCLELLGRPFEYSICELSEPLRMIVNMVFPDLAGAETILAVPTFQGAAFGLDFAPGAPCPRNLVSAEMNRLHLNFVKLESEMYRRLKLLGYLFDCADPLTGVSMHTTCGTTIYSEVHGGAQLLGYEIKQFDALPMLLHPQFGTGSYPGTLFSTAPADILNKCMEDSIAVLLGGGGGGSSSFM